MTTDPSGSEPTQLGGRSPVGEAGQPAPEDAGSGVRERLIEAGERITERHMLDALRTFYDYRHGDARRYAIAEHPDCDGGRIADFVAVDAWTRDKHAVIGHEVKVTRSDWLAELRQPAKADAWRRYCRRWWLVVPSLDIVRDDLPDGWGLMLVTAGSVVPVVPAPPLRPAPMPWSMTARLMRSIASTCADGAR